MTMPTAHDVANAARRTKIAVLLRHQVTVGWVLFVTVVVFISVGLIAWSVRANYQADNDRVTQALHDNCVSANDRRADAAVVANADVASDRAIWLAIDELIPDGLPEPARTVIFSRLDEREARIIAVYKAVPCPSGPNDETVTVTSTSQQENP